LLAGIPNAMPSLHIACALLIFFLSRPWKWFRCIAGIYLALTVLAVFSTGEHYEVDAIVAIPYALTIMAFASSVKERTSVLRAGAGMLILWLVVLRFGSFNPWTSWGLVLTTVAAGFVMERRFAKSLWGAAIPRAVRECGPNGQPFLAAQAFSQAFSPAEPPRSRGTLLSI
jgi:hypothetical protein